MRKIGLFGGSFDPIHFGHLNLALEILEKTDLDEILFCPANISPHKLENPPKVDGKNRLAMISIAIEGIDGFAICEEEIKRDPPSYTIDTIKILKKKYQEIRFVLAQDSLSYFCDWKDYQEILKLAPLIVGTRANFSHVEFPKELKNHIDKNLIVIKEFEMSSTDVRERLAKGLFCGHLVPAKVLDYIYKHSLY